MQTKDFNKLARGELNHCLDILVQKGKDYSYYEDRLQHFKDAAAFLNCNSCNALLGQLTKHLISIKDMCPNAGLETTDKWQEKITDAINYLLLLYALVCEEVDKCSISSK